MMRKTVPALLAASVLLTPGPAAGQDLDASVRTLAEENARRYVAPIASGLGAGLSSAWYSTPEVRGVGGFYLGLDVMGAWVPEADKTFRAILPSSITVEELNGNTYTDPYGASPGQATPSAAGDGEGAVFEPQGQFRQDLEANGRDPANFALRFPEGLGFFAVPSFVPRLTVGVPGSTEVTVRYLPSLDLFDEFGSLDAFGFGARHQLNRWLPETFPLRVSVAAGIQHMELGEILSTDSRTVQVAAGKGFEIAELYGALRWESSETSVEYTLENPRLPEDQSTLSVSADGANSFGLTLGLTLDVLMQLNVSYTFAEYGVLTAGAGYGI